MEIQKQGMFPIERFVILLFFSLLSHAVACACFLSSHPCRSGTLFQVLDSYPPMWREIKAVREASRKFCGELQEFRGRVVAA
eukprot:6373911-Karenia_brevis.AAC.1